MYLEKINCFDNRLFVFITMETVYYRIVSNRFICNSYFCNQFIYKWLNFIIHRNPFVL